MSRAGANWEAAEKDNSPMEASGTPASIVW